jgi:hypothetical protein
MAVQLISMEPNIVSIECPHVTAYATRFATNGPIFGSSFGPLTTHRRANLVFLLGRRQSLLQAECTTEM